MIAPVETEVNASVHLRCVDGLRAIAAGAVFVHHLGFYTGANHNSAVGPVLARLDVGVPVFFALSAYLLFRPYIASILDDTSMPDLRSFYTKRFFRIFPAYWVILTVVLLVLRPDASQESSVVQYPLHYLLIQIYPNDTFFTGISQAWSLAVEISFYLLLPFFAVALRRLVSGRTVNQRALLVLGACAFLFAASVAWRALVLGLDWSYNMVFWLPGMADYFAIGLALATIAAWGARRSLARPLVDALGAHDLLWWAIAGGTLLFVGTQLELEVGLERATWHKELYRQAAYAVIAAAMLIPAVFGNPDRGVARAVMQLRPIAWLGTISYSFYLWHTAMIETTFDLFDEQLFLNWNDLEVYDWRVVKLGVVSFVLTVAASWATYAFVELPSLRKGADLARASKR